MLDAGSPYADQALHDECSKLARTPQGQRNEQLNKSAYAIGQLVGGGLLDEQTACKRLLEAASTGEAWQTFPRREAESVVTRSLAQGRKRPRAVPHARPWGGGVRAAAPKPLPQMIAEARAPDKDHGWGADLLRNNANDEILAAIAGGVPDLEYLVEGWVAKGEIVVLAAAPKTGKTVLLTDMAIRLALGLPWLGQETQQCRVLLVDEEQGRTTSLRNVARLVQGLALDQAQVDGLLGGLDPWLNYYNRSGLRLDTEAGRERLVRTVVRHEPGVIIIDSIAKTFGATDEKDNTALALIWGQLLDIRDALGVTIILTHHLTKAGFEPGASRWQWMQAVRGGGEHLASAERVLGLSTESNDGERQLRVIVSRNDDWEPAPMLVARELDHRTRAMRMVHAGSIGEEVNKDEVGALWLTLLAKHPDGMDGPALDARARDAGHRITTNIAKSIRSNLAERGWIRRLGRGRGALWTISDQGRWQVEG